VVGTRTQSHGINLNRDYLRQAAPEMRLLQAGVCQPWAPDLTIDNHATNGSVHRFHMTVDVPHTVASGRAEPIEFMRARMVPDVMRAVRGRGFESGWYGNFVEDERTVDRGADVDPTTAVGEGWMTYPHHPRFGSNYRGLTNRLDVLLECYSYLSFAERVATASAWQHELLRWVAGHGHDICQVVAASQRPPDAVAVRYRLEDFAAPVEILTRAPRTLDGAPTAVRIPHRARFVGSTVIARPRATRCRRRWPRTWRATAWRSATPRRGSTPSSAGRGGGHRGQARHPRGGAGGRAGGELARRARALPPGYRLVTTDQPLGAIASTVRARGDDSAVEKPDRRAGRRRRLPIWRVR
jgi:hypothetical protein